MGTGASAHAASSTKQSLLTTHKVVHGHGVQATLGFGFGFTR